MKWSKNHTLGFLIQILRLQYDSPLVGMITFIDKLQLPVIWVFAFSYIMISVTVWLTVQPQQESMYS